MASETVELAGHIVDSLILPKVLDLIVDAGVDYRLETVEIGRTNLDPSRVVIELSHSDDATIDALCERLAVQGASRVGDADAVLVPAEVDGVLPMGFHSTTNLATDVRLDGRWVPVDNPEMDCGLVVDHVDGQPRVRTLPMHRARAGDRIVIGHGGVRVHPPERDRDTRAFEFMNSDVSSEKPKALLVRQVADRLRSAHDRGGRILAVCGPAVVHTGGGPPLADLVRAGWIDVLFAGNGFATHDMESNVLGTSLGVSLTSGHGTDGGHSNHLRLINEVRRHGSIGAAVDAGYVTGGVMFECVRRGVPFVLGGSVRDDGPLPDTIADVVVAADAMRGLCPGGDGRADAGVDVARHRHRQPAARRRGDVLRGHQPGRRDEAGRSRQPPGPRHRDRRRPVPPRPRDRAHRHRMTALPWGRRYLMCPPRHYGVLYEINPWMHAEVRVDVDRARDQWEALAAHLRAAGADVVSMEPAEHLPDLVFTANAGLVSGTTFVPSHFRHAERQAETPVFASWFDGAGYRVRRLPADLDHEGAGDALPFFGADGRAVLLSGYRPRSDAAAGAAASRLLGCPVRSVELVDERLYHVDLTFCPLDDRRASARRWAGTPMGARSSRSWCPNRCG